MKVLLTGITGNLGYEVSLNLARRGIDVIPCIRKESKKVLLSFPLKFSQVIECDLLGEADIYLSEKVDYIVHCAGIVHFQKAGNTNEKMMLKIIDLARRLKIPIYFTSTAFVYRPGDIGGDFNNSYEKDKWNAEQALIKSGISYGIFRLSVLVGNSKTGEINNFSGYYLMVRAFLLAVNKARGHNRVLRFPKMLGESNIIPIDQAAEYIGQMVKQGRLGEFYVTNPLPPRADWLLNETLNFFGVRNLVIILDISFQEYGKLDLTEEETELYKFTSHFAPYWSTDYIFPPSICDHNLIDGEYMKRTLTFFNNTEHLIHE